MNVKKQVTDYTHEELVEINKKFLVAYALFGIDIMSESISVTPRDAEWMEGYMDAYEDIGRLLFASYGIDVDNLNGG